MQPLCKRIAARVADEHTPTVTPTADEQAVPFEPAATVTLAQSDTPGIAVGVPTLPAQYVPREADLRRLRAQLVSVAPALGLTGDTATLGLHGQGGIGKTVLAAALAHDTQVRRYFPDGVYWVTVGESPDLAAILIDLLGRVDGDAATAGIGGALQAKAALNAAFADRRALLVVDDVWSDDAAAALRVTGPHGRVLYTTRDERVLHAVHAEVGRVDTLTDATARRLLAGAANTGVDRLPDAAARILDETDRVALAVALVGASLRHEPVDTWATVARDLGDARATWLDHPYADAWFRALQVATRALPDHRRQLYYALAVYPTDTDIPIASVARFWPHLGSCPAAAVEPILADLARRNLVTIDDRRVRLHDLQHDYLLLHATDLALLHSELLAAYRDLCANGSWSTLPADEPYLWDHLFVHLRDAGRWHDLRATGRDLAWTLARIRRDGRVAVLADLAVARRSAPDDPALGWLDDTVRSAGHLVTRVGDLSSAAATLRAQIPRAVDLDTTPLDAHTDSTVTPQWNPPRADPRQLNVLAGHTGSVNAVAWAPDGARLASASDDGTVHIWAVTDSMNRTGLIGDS